MNFLVSVVSATHTLVIATAIPRLLVPKFSARVYAKFISTIVAEASVMLQRIKMYWIVVVLIAAYPVYVISQRWPTNCGVKVTS